MARGEMGPGMRRGRRLVCGRSGMGITRRSTRPRRGRGGGAGDGGTGTLRHDWCEGIRWMDVQER